MADGKVENGKKAVAFEVLLKSQNGPYMEQKLFVCISKIFYQKVSKKYKKNLC